MTWSCTYGSSNPIRKYFCPHFYLYLCMKAHTDVLSSLPVRQRWVWASAWWSKPSDGGKGGGYGDRICYELLEGQLSNWQCCCVSAYASAHLNAENGRECLDAGMPLHFGKKSIQIFFLEERLQYMKKWWSVWTTKLPTEVHFPCYADGWSVHNGGFSSLLWLSAEKYK